ncbi:hypothetical protein [Mycoplasma struthionis]|uniref:hypothetical protein n=1 Tax=Mycoplasma struthionis TaxID=538220 RepID=UPI0013003BF1|nr:hypothetical protein [Mycoplasma struthionis]
MNRRENTAEFNELFKNKYNKISFIFEPTRNFIKNNYNLTIQAVKTIYTWVNSGD